MRSPSKRTTAARRLPARAALPPEVPEARTPTPAPEELVDLPEHIRLMLEAAYT